MEATTKKDGKVLVDEMRDAGLKLIAAKRATERVHAEWHRGEWVNDDGLCHGHAAHRDAQNAESWAHTTFQSRVQRWHAANLPGTTSDLSHASAKLRAATENVREAEKIVAPHTQHTDAAEALRDIAYHELIEAALAWAREYEPVTFRFRVLRLDHPGLKAKHVDAIEFITGPPHVAFHIFDGDEVPPARMAEVLLALGEAGYEFTCAAPHYVDVPLTEWPNKRTSADDADEAQPTV